MSRFGLEVIYVDGRRELHELSKEQVTVGSSAEADVSVPGVPELAPLHVLLVPRPGGCWVSVARGVPTPVTREGKPFDSGDVAFGTELDIGALTLRITEASDVIKARQKSQRSWLHVGALVALAAGAWWLLTGDDSPPPVAPKEAPSLLDDVASCSVDRPQARQRASELEREAFAYLQRYPFDAQDGIRAARMFAEAQACYQAAGLESMAGAAEKRHQDVRKRLEDDYRTLRLRLDRALSDKDYRAAQIALVELIELLQHRPGPYLDWLFKALRYVSVKIDDK